MSICNVLLLQSNFFAVVNIPQDLICQHQPHIH